MLNLKELETKLDLALEKETKESLTNWLTEKRLKALIQSIERDDKESNDEIKVKK